MGIADSGRHLKSFAMRGVEGNRVGISIDGVNLPDSEENSLYARYGNFNTSRLTIDPELVTGIDIVRGLDSFTTGSGSLGGGVNYRTLDAADIVLPGNKFGYLFNEKHRVSASYSNQLTKAFTDERSYNYLDSSWRDTDDEGERHNVNVAYEYFPTGGYLSYLKAEYDY